MKPSKHPTDHRETLDTYRDELFRHQGYRVIVCKDRIQWILQRQRPSGAKWMALGYFRTRKALQRLWTGLHGRPAPQIAALPASFSQRLRARVLVTLPASDKEVHNG